MRKFGRFILKELSFNRVFSAIITRIYGIPHTVLWKFHPNADKNRQKITTFHNIHKGEQCFIVANGPSLIKTDLNLLQDKYTIGLNRIYLNFSKSTFRPTYYVAVNELVLKQFSNEISQLEMPKFLNWNQHKHFDQYFGEIAYLKSKNVIYDSFQKDLTRPMVFGATVTFVALQLAYYMGFQKVILVGLDHNYAETGIPNKIEKRVYDRDESHFHPDYFPKGIKWQTPDLFRSEIDFQLARDVYENDNREIIDATIGGKCVIFEKVDFKSLF